MHAKHYLISGTAVVLSFVAGFLLANSLNRNEISELNRLRDSAAQEQSSPKSAGSGADLTNQEIEQKIKEADADPKNFGFQKGLALGLYRFAAIKQDKRILEEVERLLTRAHELNQDDYEVLVSFANIEFDLGRLNDDSARVGKSRLLYAKALEKNPKDTNVLADLAMSYIDVDPQKPLEAVKYLKMALEIDPRKEKALAGLIIAYKAAGMNAEAVNAQAELAKVNPNHPDLMPSNETGTGGSK